LRRDNRGVIVEAILGNTCDIFATLPQSPHVRPFASIIVATIFAKRIGAPCGAPIVVPAKSRPISG
jgi:hypothetical protein